MRAFLLVLMTIVAAWTPAWAQERFDELEIGPMIYQNVEILNKTDTDLFIKHSKGACNIKVADLSNDLRIELGYAPLEPRQPMDLGAVEMDPRIQEMNTRVAEEVEAMIKAVAPAVLFGVLGGFFLLYLFTSFCFKLICEKAGTPASILIWVPILQWFPLFRAARMPGWSVLALLAPLVFTAVASLKLPSELSLDSPSTMIFLGILAFSLLLPLITLIVWCVRICEARGKSGVLALLLILPITSIFAFLYLAFSAREDEEDEAHSGLLTFS